jgi:hypothetical protein
VCPGQSSPADVSLAAGHILDVCGMGQHQLEVAIGQDVPYQLPIDAGRFYGDMRTFVLGQPVRQGHQAIGCILKGANP